MSLVKFPPHIDPGPKFRPRFVFLWTFGFIGVIQGTIQRLVLDRKG